MDVIDYLGVWSVTDAGGVAPVALRRLLVGVGRMWWWIMLGLGSA